jgi:putative copper export protein
LLLDVARGLQVAAVLSLFGALLHRVAIVRPVCAGADPRTVAAIGVWLRCLIWVSFGVALGTWVVWLLLQAGSMAGEWRLPDMLVSAPSVLFETRFGTALLVRLAFLVAAGLLVAAGGLPGTLLALLAAAGALVTQSWMGHPAASGDPSLLAASALHILAAGAWLGGLVPLWLLVGALPGPRAARASARFFWIGLLSVLVLAATAFWQGARLIGSAAGLIGTDYGHLAVVKLALFMVLLLLAANNRVRLTPALAGADGAEVKRRLRRSIAAATLIGLGVVLTASVLASEPPVYEAAQ